MKGQSLWLYVHRRVKSDYFPHILWVRIWSFHLCPNKQFDFFHVRTHTALGIYATYCKRNRRGERVLFNSPSERCSPPRNKMRFILSWPQREFHRSVTVKMPTRSMVHETASFYWHGIQSVPPGYMSLALLWGPPIAAARCILLPNPILYSPALPPPSLHSLREYNQPCQERHNHLLSGLIVSDWLCKVFLRPSPRLCNPTELARCQVILPHPSPSHPLTSPTFASHWVWSDGKTRSFDIPKLTTKVKLQKRSKRRLREHTFPVLSMRNKGECLLSAAWQRWVALQLHAQAPWRLMGSIFHCQLLLLSCSAHPLSLCIGVSFNWCASQ